MRSGTGVCAAESFRLVGDDRVASVDLNLMAKRATDWSRSCRCSGVRDSPLNREVFC